MGIIRLLVSFLVYGFMMYYMTKSLIQYDNDFNWKDTNTSIWKNKLLLCPIIVFAFFAALRWNVGEDCQSYIKMYYGVMADESSEAGWILVEKILMTFGLSYHFFFFVVAFAQIAIPMYAMRDKSCMLIFFPLALFLSLDYWTWMAAMRQTLACSIAFLSIYYMDEKKYGWCVLAVLIAMSFHRSAYAMFFILPLLWLSRGCIFNIYIQLAIYFICFAMQGSFISDFINNLLSDVSASAGYEENQIQKYLENTYDINFGLFSYTRLISLGILIWVSNDVKQLVDSKLYNCNYNLFFIGACLLMLFYTNQGMLRIIQYFTYSTVLVLSATMYYYYKIYKKEGRYLFAYRLLMLFIVVGVAYYLVMPSFASESMEAILYKFCFGHPIPTFE